MSRESQALEVNEAHITTLVMRGGGTGLYHRMGKRALDLVISTSGLVLASPFLAIIAVIVKTTSRGPIFYRHQRVGKNGKSIRIYKFRTMVVGADRMIESDFTPEQKLEYENNFKLANDYRVTKFGKILRASSLDELPQILNIIAGDMSVVGPRPVMKKELEKFGDEQAQSELLSVNPGLTGLWTTHGRSNTTYDDRVEMELFYARNSSLKLDAEIFAKTFMSVLKRDGAR